MPDGVRLDPSKISAVIVSRMEERLELGVAETTLGLNAAPGDQTFHTSNSQILMCDQN